MSTQIILQDAEMAPVLTFVIFSIPIASHDLWSDYQNQVQELWERPQGTQPISTMAEFMPNIALKYDII